MKIRKYIPLALLIVFSSVLIFLFFYMKNINYEKDEMLFKNANHSSVISIYADESGNCADMKKYKPILREEVCFNEYSNKWIDLHDVPPRLIEAFLCMEDRNFYTHNGVNLPRTLKAFLNQIFKRQNRFGASTITQQVIKNISGDNEVSIKRKVDEMLRAFSLERNHTKEQILEMYLNIIPMGDCLVGIRAATEYYFGKDVDELSIGECATLVAMTNAPSKYHPVRNPVEARKKRDIVLLAMLNCGLLNEEEYWGAVNEEITTVEQRTATQRTLSWFAETVINQVREDLIAGGMSEQAVIFLLSNGGLKIYSTEDIKATEAISSVFYSNATQKKIIENQLNCAMVIVNNDTGNLSAILGGGREKSGNMLLNLATDTPHTPGSSLKPLALYAPLLDKNMIHWGTVLDDVPTDFVVEGDVYRPYPQNLPLRYDGLTTIKDALKYSKNTIAISLYERFGKENIYSHLVNTLQFRHIIRNVQSADGKKLTDLAPAPLALGQLTYGATLKELTDAYAAFPRDGVFTESKGYLAVVDKDNNLLLQNTGSSKRIYKKETARIMNQLLCEVVNGGTAKAIQLKNLVDTAGKTGTSGEDKDRLFIGYTPYYTAGIWIAKEDSTKSLGNISLSHLALWDQVLNKLHSEIIDDSNLRAFPTGGLIRCRYCLDSGDLPCDNCKLDLRGERIREGYFTVDNMPRQFCQSHFRVLYDTLCDAVVTDSCLFESDVREISLVRLPNRAFKQEVIITDAEYMGVEIKENIPYPRTYDVPYFQVIIPDGIFIGRSKGKKQKNSACYFHKE